MLKFKFKTTRIGRFAKHLDVKKFIKEQKLGLKKEVSNENILLKLKTDLKNNSNLSERDSEVYLNLLKSSREIFHFNLRLLEECIIFISNSQGLEEFTTRINYENLTIIAKNLINEFKQEDIDNKEVLNKMVFEIFSYLIYFHLKYLSEKAE